MERDTKFFQKAEAAAALSEFKRAPMGCIAVYKNKVISVGINSHKTHPIQREYDKYRKIHLNGGCNAYLHSLHAEIDCLLSVDDEKIDMSKVELYICRLTKSGTGLAKPCPACRAYLKDRGIRKVHYTTEDSWITETFLRNH